MKKVLICGLIAASFGATSAFAAGPATANFDVTASVNTKCLSDNPTTPVAAFGAIDSFGTGTIADATADIKFKCTRGVSFTSATVSKPSSTVAGFAYTMTVDSGTRTTAGAAATGGTGAGADYWTFRATGSMTSGQAGDAGASTTDAQVLTIAF